MHRVLVYSFVYLTLISNINCEYSQEVHHLVELIEAASENAAEYQYHTSAENYKPSNDDFSKGINIQALKSPPLFKFYSFSVRNLRFHNCGWRYSWKCASLPPFRNCGLDCAGLGSRKLWE